MITTVCIDIVKMDSLYFTRKSGYEKYEYEIKQHMDFILFLELNQ